MKQLIIGSVALRHWFEDYTKEPKDLDIVVESKKGLVRTKETEYLINPVILKYQNSGYISPDNLLTLKMSHMFWDLNWEKHMYHIQFLLSKSCQYDMNLFKELREYWEEEKPKIRRSVLKVSKEDFFTNSVNNTVMEHDSLHELINPIPMYSRILKDGAEVELDENKWDKLSFEDKLEVVREESYVMAYERYITTDYRTAYQKQLKNNIIKHFPEYIAIFAIVNYVELGKPKYNYRELITNKLKQNGLQEN